MSFPFKKLLNNYRKWLTSLVLVCTLVYIYRKLRVGTYHVIGDYELKKMQRGLISKDGFQNLLAKDSDGFPILTYYFLPRKEVVLGSLFTEITSANRHTAKSLEPDFTFHIQYSSKGVTLYDHQGSGCLHRLFLYPSLPRDHRILESLTYKNLTNSYVILTLDGLETRFSVSTLMSCLDAPFVHPLSMKHSHPVSGLTVYMNACYREHAKVEYEHNSPLPPDLLTDMRECGRMESECKVQLYSAVTSHRHAQSDTASNIMPKIEFQDKNQLSVIKNLAKLMNPPRIGRSRSTGCHLVCDTIQKGETLTIFSHQGKSVIDSILMRFYENKKQILDWNELLINIKIDGEIKFQEISLAHLFGVSKSLNPSISALSGKYAKETCSISGYGEEHLPLSDVTAYLLSPMPYWEQVSIAVKFVSYAPGQYEDKAYTICHEITRVDNYYHRPSTGHLKAQQYFYTDDVKDNKILMKTETNLWGKIASLQINVDNLKARSEPMARWALLQADINTYVDSSVAASVLGTGLEDYFGYAHGFAHASNSSHSFAGVYHATEEKIAGNMPNIGNMQDNRIKYRGTNIAMSWHCYRNHILDPINYQNDVRILMESTLGDNSSVTQKMLSHEQYLERLLEKKGSLSSLVLYYEGSQPGIQFLDRINMDNKNSNGRLRVENCARNCEIFHVTSNYMGDLEKTLHNKLSRKFSSGDKFSLEFDISSFSGHTVLLRREFYSPEGGAWLSHAHLVIQGWNRTITWPSQMTSRTGEFQQYDMTLKLYEVGQMTTANKLVIDVSPKSEWIDVSYTLYQLL